MPQVLKSKKPLLNCIWCLLFCSALGHTPTVGQEQSTQYVPREAIAAVIFNIEVFKETRDADYFPYEIVSALGKQSYGFDPADIIAAKMIFGFDTDNPQKEPTMGVIVEFRNNQKMSGQLANTNPTVVDGTKIYFDRNLEMHLIQADPKTILFSTTEPFAVLMAASKNVNSPFTKLLAKSRSDHMIQLIMSVEQIRPFLESTLNQFPVPPPFGVINKLPGQIQSIDLTANMLAGIDVTIETTAYNEKEAIKVEKAMRQLLALAKGTALAFMATQVDSDDIVQQAQYDYAVRISEKLEKQLSPRREKNKVKITLKNDFANVGVLTALLLPAVQAAREAARRTASSNQIKQIGISFHDYHSTYGRLPAQAITDKKGNKLLSWRVQILPFLGYTNLYEKFHLDEPWDSQHNKKLLDEMPDVFRNPNTGKDNETHILAISGTGTGFDGNQGKKFSDFKDGLSNAILFVESDASVPWTKPVDLRVQWEDPLAQLGNLRPGIFVAGFADGSVRSIANSIDPEIITSLFRIADNK